MKVFVSWSGELSKSVAELLKSWIKCVLQATDPFISTEDIDKGAVWFNEISDQLAGTSVGIVCLTSDNTSNPWVLFEAGALARGLKQNLVCTFLVNIAPSDLKQPLASFNATLPNKNEVFRLVETVNGQLKEGALSNEILKLTFDQWWPSFETRFSAILAASSGTKAPQKRSSEDTLAEILLVCRSIHAKLNREGSVTRVIRQLPSGLVGRAPRATDDLVEKVNAYLSGDTSTVAPSGSYFSDFLDGYVAGGLTSALPVPDPNPSPSKTSSSANRTPKPDIL